MNIAAGGYLKLLLDLRSVFVQDSAFEEAVSEAFCLSHRFSSRQSTELSKGA